jgi:hypothetical protein
MRVRCPHCAEKFDVATRKIIAEAERLKDQRNGNADVDGNFISREQLAAQVKLLENLLSDLENQKAK